MLAPPPPQPPDGWAATNAEEEPVMNASVPRCPASNSADLASAAHSSATLTAEDILDLAVLGAAAEAALPVTALPVILREIGGDAVTPTAEVVAGRAADLAARGLLVEAPTLGGGSLGAGSLSGGAWAVATSAAGRRHARALMQRPGPPVDSALGAVADRLRLCLLDLLDPADRGAVLAQLEATRRERLGRLRRAETHCPCRHSFMRRWLAHETGRLDAELSWIGRLASGT
jgi:hypothetical protein